jgi:hypothetical protein
LREWSEGPRWEVSVVSAFVVQSVVKVNHSGVSVKIFASGWRRVYSGLTSARVLSVQSSDGDALEKDMTKSRRKVDMKAVHETVPNVNIENDTTISRYAIVLVERF